MSSTDRPNPWRYFHLGLELAIASVALALAGLYLDRRYGTAPWGLLIGATLGFSSGMYLFITQARAAMADSAAASRRRRHHHQDKRDENPDPPDTPDTPDRS